MFIAQMWGAVIGTVLTVSQWEWLMALPGICTPDAPFRLICPDEQYNYTCTYPLFVAWNVPTDHP